MKYTVSSAALILLLHGALGQPAGSYVTISSKKMNVYLPARSESFAIPNGQCSGFIDESLLCPYEGAGGVQIVVKDYAPFPDVRIGNGLRNATVTRAPNEQGRCDNEAEVQLYTYCVSTEPKRHRRSITYLAPAAA